MSEIQKLLYSYKNLLVSVILILVSMAGIVLIVWPAVKRTDEVYTDIGELKKKNDLLNRKIAILENIDESTYTKLYTELLRAVPSDQSLITLFSTIDGLGAASGVTIGNITLSKGGQIATDSASVKTPEEKKDGSTVLTFSVKITGSYEQLRTFFARVIEVRRILRIRSFDISLSDPSNISVGLLMDAFYSPYRTSVGAPESPIEPLTEADSQIINRVSGMPLVAGVESAINPQIQKSPTRENKSNLFEP